MSYGPRQLADDLKLLQRIPIEAKPDLKAWYKEARKVQDRIRQVPEFANSIPEAVWHFLTLLGRNGGCAAEEADGVRERGSR